MIRFEGVLKRFPGAERPAVEALDLVVPEGKTCVLLGPSGCGKSTTLRMANRLIEPDSGRISIGGIDIAQTDPVKLRRSIGYVLQGIGLFPHRTVAQNVAAVPELLGWPRRRIEERIDVMLDLVGLDPAAYRDRRPDALSGGQRQRVGVARALAADPPILLMDEPFGAVDPVARGRLQAEIRAILQRVRKTVMIVTHDIAEGMLMGDAVAVMREGLLIQADAPTHVLAAPADTFVAAFIGEDRALRRLALVSVAESATAGDAAGVAAIDSDTSLASALSVMLASGVDTLRLEGEGPPRVVTLDAIRKAACET